MEEFRNPMTFHFEKVVRCVRRTRPVTTCSGNDLSRCFVQFPVFSTLSSFSFSFEKDKGKKEGKSRWAVGGKTKEKPVNCRFKDQSRVTLANFIVHRAIEFSVRFLRTTHEELPSVSFSFAYISHQAERPVVSNSEDELPRKKCNSASNRLEETLVLDVVPRFFSLVKR